MHAVAQPHIPAILSLASMASVLLGLACAAGLALDVARRPQKMWIMNLVWPLTGLYAGPLAIWAYARMGRAVTRQGQGRSAPEQKPFWQSVLVGALHCGAGCTLGDIVSETLVFATGLVLFGSALLTKFSSAFVFAYAAGVFFQFFSIAPMRGLGLRDGLIAAVKADTLSLVAYEAGMFAWMALVQIVLLPGLEPDRWTFWLMMQIAMLLGLLTTYPVNWWLIRIGVKEAM